MAIKFLDPTYKELESYLRVAPRLKSLKGTVIAIISNGKRGTRPFFDFLESELRQHHSVAEIIRITKSNYSTPVDKSLLTDSDRWNGIISGIGD